MIGCGRHLEGGTTCVCVCWSKNFINVAYIGNLNIVIAYTKDFIETEIQTKISAA